MPILAASEKFADLCHIIKPFVVVQIQKPFAVRVPETFISGGRKIIAPGKGKNFMTIL